MLISISPCWFPVVCYIISFEILFFIFTTVKIVFIFWWLLIGLSSLGLSLIWVVTFHISSFKVLRKFIFAEFDTVPLSYEIQTQLY